MAAMMGCCVLPLFALTPKNKTMKELDVKKVSMANIPVEAVPALLDEEKVAFQPISTVNWAAYPYCPDVKFRIAHTDNAILIHYKVKEASVRAVAGKDNGPVWEDACVEFLSIPAGDGVYYNMECNCAGRLLIGAGAGRSDRRHASQEILDKVQRWSSLGREDFEERVGECSWEVALVYLIPLSLCITLPHWTVRLSVPISINAVISCKLPIFCHGIPLTWKNRTSTVRNFSERYASNKV